MRGCHEIVDEMCAVWGNGRHAWTAISRIKLSLPRHTVRQCFCQSTDGHGTSDAVKSATNPGALRYSGLKNHNLTTLVTVFRLECHLQSQLLTSLYACACHL